MTANHIWKLSILLGVLFDDLSITAPTDYSLLVFSQQWPRTTCIRHNRQCKNIRNDDWTIHGIWPSNTQQRGPQNCRKNSRFNATELQSIRSELSVRWLDVINTDPEKFWKHEWEKHGSCSLDLTDLDTQLKYFRQALKWNEIFKIGSILKNAGITPGKNYSIAQILEALNQGLKVSLQVTCALDENKNQYLHEVRINMDKKLKLFNYKGQLKTITNCSGKKQVEYPSRHPIESSNVVSSVGSQWDSVSNTTLDNTTEPILDSTMKPASESTSEMTSEPTSEKAQTPSMRSDVKDFIESKWKAFLKVVKKV